MIESPQVVQTTPLRTAALHLVVPRDQIRQAMGPAIREVMTAIAAQGFSPAGPWFTHHLRRPTESFDFEVCVPVDAVVSPSGRVRPGLWPAMRVARTVYHGPHEGLAGAWGEFLGWVGSQGHRQADDLWERYLVGPDTTPDPALWRTELNRPLVA